MIPSAPKYSKVELQTIADSNDPRVPSSELLVFFDCGVMITGDYIIIIIDTRDEMGTNQTSIGKIFPLNKINAYKTYSS